MRFACLTFVTFCRFPYALFVCILPLRCSHFWVVAFDVHFVVTFGFNSHYTCNRLTGPLYPSLLLVYIHCPQPVLTPRFPPHLLPLFVVDPTPAFHAFPVPCIFIALLLLFCGLGRFSDPVAAFCLTPSAYCYYPDLLYSAIVCANIYYLLHTPPSLLLLYAFITHPPHPTPSIPCLLPLPGTTTAR